MAKTRHRVNIEEVEREPEAPAHKRRREFKQLLHQYNYDEELFIEDEDAIETRERIKRSRKAN